MLKSSQADPIPGGGIVDGLVTSLEAIARPILNMRRRLTASNPAGGAHPGGGRARGDAAQLPRQGSGPGKSEHRPRINTPTALKLAAGAIVAAVVLAGIAGLIGISRLQAAGVTIGEDAKPGLVLAESLSATLADADAQVTASALGNGKAWPRYRADVAAAASQITAAIGSAQHDPAELALLQKIQVQLADFAQMIGGSSVTSPDIFVASDQLARTTTLWASRAARTGMVRSAQDAADLAGRDLSIGYARYFEESQRTAKALLASLLLLLFVLGGTQALITLRTKRLINIPLALATILVASASCWSLYAIRSADAGMAASRDGSIDDLGQIYDAKVVAYLMKADQSMWLFELRKARFEQRRLRAAYARKFSLEAGRLIDADNVAKYAGAIVEDEQWADPVDETGLAATRAKLDATTLARAAGQVSDAAAIEPVIGGLLGAELQHFRGSPDGWEQAAEAVTDMLRYLAIDREIRGTALGASRDDAVLMSVGDTDGSANWAFARLDAALDRLIAIDQAAFDRDYAAARARLGTLPIAVALSLVLTVLLAGAGLWPRYREYL